MKTAQKRHLILADENSTSPVLGWSREPCRLPDGADLMQTIRSLFEFHKTQAGKILKHGIRHRHFAHSAAGTGWRNASVFAFSASVFDTAIAV